jgi:hypothetical protein
MRVIGTSNILLKLREAIGLPTFLYASQLEKYNSLGKNIQGSRILLMKMEIS